MQGDQDTLMPRLDLYLYFEIQIRIWNTNTVFEKVFQMLFLTKVFEKYLNTLFYRSICKYFFWPIKYFSFLLQPHMNSYFLLNQLHDKAEGENWQMKISKYWLKAASSSSWIFCQDEVVPTRQWCLFFKPFSIWRVFKKYLSLFKTILYL